MRSDEKKTGQKFHLPVRRESERKLNSVGIKCSCTLLLVRLIPYNSEDAVDIK